MKFALLLALAGTALSFSACTVAVVDPHPHAVVGAGYNVQYYHGRPYYYSGRTRYWGYPRGYVAPGHHHASRSRVVVY